MAGHVARACRSGAASAMDLLCRNPVMKKRTNTVEEASEWN
jgi:hypothetical protein